MYSPHPRVVVVCLLFGVALFLRVLLADRQLLLADEFFSLAMATGHSLEHPASAAAPSLGDFVEERGAVPAGSYRRYLEHETPPASVGRVVRAVRLSDTNPPLYYVLLHGWTRTFGTSDRTLALFSVLWAAATLPLLWVLGCRLGGDRAAVAACLLFTVAPLSIYYSVEGRMYSLLWFLSAGVVWGTLALHDRGRRPLLLLAWLLLGAAGLLTHYFFAWVWAACGAWLILWPGRVPRGWVLAAGFLTGVLVLPWYLHLPESLAGWRITGHWLDGSLSARQTIAAPFVLAWSLLSGRGLWGGSIRSGQIGALLILPVVLGLLYRARSTMLSPPWLLAWLWVLAACAGPPLFDLLRGTHVSLIPRYALAGMPGALLLVGALTAGLRQRHRAIVLALLIAAWLPGLVHLVRGSTRDSRPYRAVAARVGHWAGAADLVLVHSIPSGIIGIARYLPPELPMAGWVGQLGQRRMPDDIIALAGGRERVALVTIHTVGEPAPEADWLRAHARAVQELAYPTARVLYFSGVGGPVQESHDTTARR